MAVFAVNQYRFPGVIIQAHLVRYYPFGALMEPVLGYVGRINASELAKVDPTNYSASNYIGKTGVEKYDDRRHSTAGNRCRGTNCAQYTKSSGDCRC